MYKNYQVVPEDFVFPFIIHEKNKDREIITYKNNDNGLNFRAYHEKLLKKLEKFPSSSNSFAYKKKISTKEAILPHIKSNLFIKIDIHSFFESITFNKFISEISKYDSLLKKFNISTNDINDCFYKGHLSLGFVTSPKISDMFLYGFDKEIEEELKRFKNIKYSRYCDDILISTNDRDFGELLTSKSIIQENLRKLDLCLNDKKMQKFDLSINPSVQFLGLNISKDVKNPKINKISISKSFILKTLDIIQDLMNLICQYNKKMNVYDSFKATSEIELEEKDALYNELKKLKIKYKYKYSTVCSRISYIKYNSKFSYDKMKTKFYNRFHCDWDVKLWQL